MITEAFVLTKKGKPSGRFERLSWSLPVLEANQVLIESEAFGLNYADIMASQGLYREAPPLPCVVGYEVVGRIAEVGTAVDPRWNGKRVLAFCRFGGYAKHVITQEYALVAIDDMPAADALALCTQGVTAYYMAHYLSPVQRGERVLVHAAGGGVGTLLVQMCKSAGAEVFGKIGSAKKHELVAQLGADHVIDYSQGDYALQLQNLLGSERLDVSFNPVAGDTFKKDFALLGSGGRLILFGGSQLTGGKWGIFSALNFIRKMGRPLPIGFMMRSKSVLGVNMLKIADNKPAVLAFCLTEVFKLYAAGTIQPQVGGTYPTSSFDQAVKHLASGRSTGKIAVVWE